MIFTNSSAQEHIFVDSINLEIDTTLLLKQITVNRAKIISITFLDPGVDDV